MDQNQKSHFEATKTTRTIAAIAFKLHTYVDDGRPCSQPRATASEDIAALGSLQASPQVPGQSTGVAGECLLSKAFKEGMSIICSVTSSGISSTSTLFCI
ncbi:UNVERIFIED_CONTAM: hypothetical protein FKN15_003597 [Acipenser sinensis]